MTQKELAESSPLSLILVKNSRSRRVLIQKIMGLIFFCIQVSVLVRRVHQPILFVQWIDKGGGFGLSLGLIAVGTVKLDK